MRYHKSDKA
jgi:hypothetical protein